MSKKRIQHNKFVYSLRDPSNCIGRFVCFPVVAVCSSNEPFAYEAIAG